MNYKYSIETLNIEKYKLITLRRQFIINQHEGQVSFASEIEEVDIKLRQIKDAIEILLQKGKR